MALRYLVPALAVVGTAAAAACSGTTTIQSQGDASALASCLTYSGTVAIATSVSEAISLDSIRRIDGSLEAKNVPHMPSLSADSLSQIDDTFFLDNIQILTSLTFPALTAVDTVLWLGLPNLQGLSFTSSLQQASTLSIQNTELSSLQGIDLKEVDTLILANNNFLSEVSMQLGNISTGATIMSNGRDLKVSFPNLIWANNMTVHNASSIDLASLASVNGSLGFYSNFFSEFSTPNLTTVGAQLSFVQNPNLANISMPELKTVTGGVLIANNNQLKKINGFPRLTDIFGAIDFFGTFTTVTLPSLNLVKGAFNLQSNENIVSTCDHFHSLWGPNKSIRGKFTCAGKQSNPGGTGTLSSGTNSGNGGGGSTTSSSSRTVLISSAAGFIGIVAAIFGML